MQDQKDGPTIILYLNIIIIFTNTQRVSLILLVGLRLALLLIPVVLWGAKVRDVGHTAC